MPRDTRLIIPDIFHHAIQRGNNRQNVFNTVDPELYYVVLKYIEMNPVRAGVVSDAVAYPWSSASYHLSGKANPTVTADCLQRSVFRYKDFFYQDEKAEDLEAIRTATQQGKAWDKPGFLEKLAKSLGRVVTPRTRGRPKKKNK